MRNSLQFVANSALFSAFAFMKTQKNQKLFNTRHSIANKIWEILPQAPKIKLLKCNLSDIQLGSNGQTILNMQPHQNKSCLGVLLGRQRSKETVRRKLKDIWAFNLLIYSSRNLLIYFSRSHAFSSLIPNQTMCRGNSMQSLWIFLLNLNIATKRNMVKISESNE